MGTRPDGRRRSSRAAPAGQFAQALASVSAACGSSPSPSSRPSASRPRPSAGPVAEASTQATISLTSGAAASIASSIAPSEPCAARRSSTMPDQTRAMRSVNRVKTPSRPMPPIAAWKRSGWLSREQVSRSPLGSASSKLRMWSPNAPARQLFLPWMFAAAAPATVTTPRPGTTGGRQPSGRTRRQRSAMVTPGSTVATPVAGSQMRMRAAAVQSSVTPPWRMAASP